MSTRWMTWIDGEEATVEILKRHPNGRIEARIETEAGPRTLTLDLERTGSLGEYLLQDGHQKTRAWVGPSENDARKVSLGRARTQVRLVPELDAMLGIGGSEAGRGEISVAMPGQVVKILVTDGQEVTQGQPLLIVEAMKMENEVKSDCAGIVEGIFVEEGGAVEAGKLLVQITPSA